MRICTRSAVGYFGEPRQAGRVTPSSRPLGRETRESISRIGVGRQNLTRCVRFCSPSKGGREKRAERRRNDGGFRMSSKSPDHYSYRVTWSPEDKEYLALCVEFPSLSWLAAAPELALTGIRKVVAGVVAEMRASGEVATIPLAEKRYSGRLGVPHSSPRASCARVRGSRRGHQLESPGQRQADGVDLRDV